MTNPTYSQSKIYVIMAPNMFKLYIGSTTQYLSARMFMHKKRTSKCKAKVLFKDKAVTMILIENFPCENGKQLREREGEWIKAMMGSGMCVNRYVAGRTLRESHIATHEKYRTKRNAAALVRNTTKYTCECGSSLNKGHKTRHEQTKKHINLMSSQFSTSC
jgi:hypothetical protein